MTQSAQPHTQKWVAKKTHSYTLKRTRNTIHAHSAQRRGCIKKGNKKKQRTSQSHRSKVIVKDFAYIIDCYYTTCRHVLRSNTITVLFRSVRVYCLNWFCFALIYIILFYSRYKYISNLEACALHQSHTYKLLDTHTHNQQSINHYRFQRLMIALSMHIRSLIELSFLLFVLHKIIRGPTVCVIVRCQYLH